MENKRKITGKDLMSWGYSQGRILGDLLKIINVDFKQMNYFEIEILLKKLLLSPEFYLGHSYLGDVAINLIPRPETTPHEYPIDYFKNIRPVTEEEELNVSSVFKTMDVLMKTPTVVGGAVMPDACPTGEDGQIPVGGVVVTKNAIHPSMHSADVCCSVMMTSFGYVDPKLILDAVNLITHFGPGGRGLEDRFNLPDDIIKEMSLNSFLDDDKSLNLAKSHLGTQGDGNHFVFVGTLESTGETVMVTHHGSRGLGANLYKKGMVTAEKFRRDLSPKTLKRNAWIPFETDEGKSYWEALQIVRRWTKLNHEVLHRGVCDSQGIDSVFSFWNEHNFVFKDGDLFYHAKGATPLDDKYVPDSYKGLRLIPLNMSEPVLIVKGETTKNNLGFAPHGAGRNISRSEHKRNKSEKTFNEVFLEETKGLDVRFFSGEIDISELPSAYKNAETVQNQMNEFELGEVVDRVLPYGCIMAGGQGEPFWKKNK